jgi:hypothetical protein
MAVDAWQSEIGDHDVKREFAKEIDGALTRFGFGDFESLLTEAFGHHRSESRLIIYE